MFGKTARYNLRLDQSCIFIATNDSAEHASSVTGRFNLSLPDTIWVRGIKVRLRGSFRVRRDGFMIPEDREEVTHVQEQILASSKGASAFQMPAGSYEFLFDIPLSSNIAGTLTGPEHNYHTYRVDAVIERTLWKDIVVSQPLGIYKLPGLETSPLGPLATDFPPTVEGRSDHDIRYCMTMPNQNIPFGSIFSVDCGFAVPSKDITLRAVTVEVVEKHNLWLCATASQNALHNMFSITATRRHVVFKETHPVAPENGMVSCTGTEWCMSTRVCLPRTLDSCSQSATSKNVKIGHALLITAEFQDEQGQLLDKIVNILPFSIYMTPSVLGPDGSICGKVIENNTCPPPPYGQHTGHARLLESAGQCVAAVSTLEGGLGDPPHESESLELPPSYNLAVACVPSVRPSRDTAPLFY